MYPNTAPVKKFLAKNIDIFSSFTMKTYDVGTH